MYKTIRHGENSLQYTILPQNDVESRMSICVFGPINKRKQKRFKRRSFFAYLGLIFVCTVIIGAILVPFLVSAECLPSPTEWFVASKTTWTKCDFGIINNIKRNKSNTNNTNNEQLHNFSYANGKTANNNNTSDISIATTAKVNAQNDNKNINTNLKDNNTNDILQNTSKNNNILNNKISNDNSKVEYDENFENLQSKQNSLFNNNAEKTKILQNAQSVTNKLKVTNTKNYPNDENYKINDLLTETNAVPSINVALSTIETILSNSRNNYESQTQPQRDISQTALNLRPITSLTLAQVNNNNNNSLVKSSSQNFNSNVNFNSNEHKIPIPTTLTRTIQVPLLKATIKKPHTPILTYTQHAKDTPPSTTVEKAHQDIKQKEKTADWLQAHWPYIDPSTYFQWTGYKAEDSVLLPALLGFALIGIIFIVTICLIARKKRTKISSVRKRNRNNMDETDGEDNTTLLITTNLSDED